MALPQKGDYGAIYEANGVFASKRVLGLLAELVLGLRCGARRYERHNAWLQRRPKTSKDKIQRDLPSAASTR
jgi:hypothetical protein